MSSLSNSSSISYFTGTVANTNPSIASHVNGSSSYEDFFVGAKQELKSIMNEFPAHEGQDKKIILQHHMVNILTGDIESPLRNSALNIKNYSKDLQGLFNQIKEKISGEMYIQQIDACEKDMGLLIEELKNKYGS